MIGVPQQQKDCVIGDVDGGMMDWSLRQDDLTQCQYCSERKRR